MKRLTIEIQDSFNRQSSIEIPMEKTGQLLIFALDKQRYALRLSIVERIVRSVEVTSLPKAPDIVFGLINIKGQIIPVLNIRKRFKLPEQGIGLRDVFIIASTSKRKVALVADSIQNVFEYSEKDEVLPENISPGLEQVEGVVKLSNGMVLIHNLNTFLYPEEDEILEDSMSRQRQ